MVRSQIRLAIIEDEQISGLRLQEHLDEMGYAVDLFFEGNAFLEAFLASPHDLVITDMKMPGLSGMDILRRVKARHRETEVVVITGYASIDSAIEAVRAGAFHYLTKPIRLAEFDNLISRIVEKIAISYEASSLRALMAQKAGKAGIIGTSPEMQKVFRLIDKVAPLDCPVIIQGESGTGKELVARAIHWQSHRQEAPIVSFNCGGFSPELIANELFGHEKGAFTGATEKHTGKFFEADGGTFFLDEIGELPLPTQVKLLRALQEGEVEPVGGRRAFKVDVRIISATNRDLIADVKAGRFREDLFYRLHVFPISVPPLRKRPEDIAVLARHFLTRIAAEEARRARSFSAEALARLAAYAWPGNVRQLENAIFRAVVLADGEEIGLREFPHLCAPTGADALEPLIEHAPATAASLPDEAEPAEAPALTMLAPSLPLTDAHGEARPLDEIEREVIRFAIAHYRGQMSEVARRLHIGRSTLYRKLERLGLDDDGDGLNEKANAE
jgi:DNA-binding NtrC family response regulator